MQQPAEAAPQAQIAHGARNAILFAVMLGLFLAALDQTVVGTALPRIVTDLHGNSLYTWVVTAYLLSSTITVPIYGKLSDIYGRKVMLLIGISIFLLGSFLSGLSQNMDELIAFRGLQGLGAGALFPISLAVIGDLFSPRERGRYQGLFGAVFGLSFLLGPLIGGGLTDSVSWHWVFYVNMPIGIPALIVIATVLPNFHPDVRSSARDIDYLGIVVFTAAVVPLLIGLTNKGLTNAQGNLNGWTDPSVGGLILLDLALLAVFVFIESRVKQPIVPLNLFRDRTYSLSNLAVFVMAFGMFAAIIFLPRYYQAVRGLSATASGYMTWPLLVGLMGTSVLSGLIISRTGRYKYLMTGAMVLFVLGSFLMTHITSTTSNVDLWFWMLIMGVGIGPSMSGFTVVVQNSAPVSQLGVATSTLTFFRQIGGSIGLAISGTFFIQQFSTDLPKQLAAQKVPASVLARLQGSGASNLTGVGLASQLKHAHPGLSTQLISRVVIAAHNAISAAIGDVFWLAVGASIIAFFATALIIEHPLRQRPAATAEAADVITGADVTCVDREEEAVG